MMAFIITVHVIICFALITLVLIQRGRGSGLVESFSGVESMFGTKTNAFLTRTTTVLSVLFFFTCLSLAILSVRQSRSLMRNIKTQAPVVNVPTIPEQAKAPVNTEPKAQASVPQTTPTQAVPQQPASQDATKAQ